MKGSFLRILAACSILVGCSLEKYEGGGGFETPDLSAKVVDSTGYPVFGARVWLVRSNGDSAPATALDSTFSDKSGTAHFPMANDFNRDGLGLDAQLGDFVGIAPRALEHSDQAIIQITPGIRFQVDDRSHSADTSDGDSSNADSIFVHIPGSHFSASSATGFASLLVPTGTWDFVIRKRSRTEILDSVRVTKDSIAPVYLPMDTGKLAPTETLLDIPSISADSFRFDDQVFHATNLPAPAWRAIRKFWCDSGVCLGRSPTVSYTGADSSSDISISTYSRIDTSPIAPVVRMPFAGTAQMEMLLPDTGLFAFETDLPSSLPTEDTSKAVFLWVGDTSGTGIEAAMITESHNYPIPFVRGCYRDSGWSLGDSINPIQPQHTWFFRVRATEIVAYSGLRTYRAKLPSILGKPRVARILLQVPNHLNPGSLEIRRTRFYK